MLPSIAKRIFKNRRQGREVHFKRSSQEVVDTSKSEESERPQCKSRLVAGGDLGQTNLFRADSQSDFLVEEDSEEVPLRKGASWR